MKLTTLLLWSSLSYSTLAQIIIIDGLQANGSLSWSGDATNFASYHVEWSPSVNGPWSASWNNLTNLPASNTTMSVAVPMFYRIVGLTRPPVGDTCETASTILPGTNVGTTVGFTNDYTGAALGSPSPGRDRVYRITVPPNRILTATMSPTNSPSFDAVLLMFSGAVDCSQVAANPLAATDAAAAGLTETLTWTNNTSNPMDILVVADSFTAEPAGNFQLTLALASSLAGDICETAEAVTPGTVNGLTTIDYSTDHATGSGCVTSSGPDRFFSISIPAGQTLTASAIPFSPWDATINIVSAADQCPAPAACLAGADNAGDSGSETAQYQNNTSAALDVYILVGGFNTDDAGPFELVTTLVP